MRLHFLENSFSGLFFIIIIIIIILISCQW